MAAAITGNPKEALLDPANQEGVAQSVTTTQSVATRVLDGLKCLGLVVASPVLCICGTCVLIAKVCGADVN